ncbi:5-dehydro-4-deoxyglucarate dehydratase [Kitasatospora sp. LaBMicrA B282]|uniref:5-dehydro-4-deoxyglucarate dehydratase n=1 Tax=Kitasatospora sp. LaBMicrA B282 TaxID=3420949 RepID=UPI003D0F24C9
MPSTPRTGPRLADRLDGLLFFPVTPFRREPDGRAGAVDLDAFTAHLSARLAAGPAAVFACCGTGEFASLGLQEYAGCVRAAVRAAAGRVPVVAGVGYGAALAGQFAGAAQAAGANGLLVLPPYLVAGDPAGLREHYRAVAGSTDLDLIVYQRGTAVFTPEVVADLAELPTVVGFKDGHGDLDLMQRIICAVRERHGAGRLRYLNGLPTAEMSQLAYRGIGVTGYSSAAFCFAPDLATAFHRAYRADDRELVDALLEHFYRPLVELRRLGSGYAVSLVKAGVRLAGPDPGPVRPPLSDPAPEHVDRLAEVISAGRRILQEYAR